MLEKCAPWRDAGANATVKQLSQNKATGAYELVFDLAVPVGETTATVTYSFYGDGALGVSLKLAPLGENLPEIPRVGFQCSIAPEFRAWTWFGRGPEENYSDRNAGTFVGLWNADVRENWFPYAKPQETANRTAVHRAVFSDSKKHGLMIR